MDGDAAIVAQARTLIGVPFRLHGRDAGTGVDCIGLVVLALERAGQMCPIVPTGYRMRGSFVPAHEQYLTAAGLHPVKHERRGDVVLVNAGVAQLHLMIATGGGYIHAHAGIGRVVEMPGASPWPIISQWRSRIDGDG